MRIRRAAQLKGAAPGQVGIDVMTIEEIRAAMAASELIYDETAVNTAFDRMASEITRDLETSLPLVLCVMVGGVVTAGHLLPRLNFPLELDYLHATRYRGDTNGGELVWFAVPRTPLEGRNILIIDDILDEGHTLEGILQECRRQGAESVHTAVLVQKQHGRCVPGAKAEYVGLTVDDRYVFGSGMDYKGYLRNAPGIYAASDKDHS